VNATELIAYVREEATLADQSLDYTDAGLLRLLNVQMRQIFEPVVSDTRSGYWLHVLQRSLGAGNGFVRLPPRLNALEQVDVYAAGRWVALKEALESEAQEWIAEYGREPYPAAYTVRGTGLSLLPAAQVSDCEIRVKGTLRPSLIYAPQTAGVIGAIDVGTGVLTLNALPTDGDTSATIGGNVTIDAIEPRNCYELTLVSARATVLDATHVQVLPGHSLARVETGDVVRVAGQTDWPQLPESFHPALASAAAVIVCRQRDLREREQSLSAQVAGTVQRLQSFLAPRVRVQTHKPIQHGWGA
jgi:hypothetical protein